jgi:hypothetical protein
MPDTVTILGEGGGPLSPGEWLKLLFSGLGFQNPLPLRTVHVILSGLRVS